MAKTEKQGKVQLKFRQKGLVNPMPKYFVRVDAVEVKWFATQTEAFIFALPKGLVVWKKEGNRAKERVPLSPIVEGKIRKKGKEMEVEKEGKLLHSHRFNFDWRK